MRTVGVVLSLVCILAFASIEGSEDAYKWAVMIWAGWWALAYVLGSSEKESETEQ